jgi:Ca-activated chloride channel family protein
VARAAQFASGISLVEVYATVTDATGKSVSGLVADDFIVEEDGRPQQVTVFAAGELSLAVALGIDRSFSMPADRLAAAVAAARRFVSALRADDRLLVLAIGSETETLSPLSGDRPAALAALDRIQTWGTTPLYDAALSALDAIQPAAGRRALVLLSDGADRYSRTTAAELVAQARRRDVLIYPVALGRDRPAVFAELASVSGGRSFHAPERRALQAALDAIATELRSQYLLGYSPPELEGGNGTWRSIRVRVRRPDLRIRARDGYYAAR